MCNCITSSVALICEVIMGFIFVYIWDLVGWHPLASAWANQHRQSNQKMANWFLLQFYITRRIETYDIYSSIERICKVIIILLKLHIWDLAGRIQLIIGRYSIQVLEQGTSLTLKVRWHTGFFSNFRYFKNEDIDATKSKSYVKS